MVALGIELAIALTSTIVCGFTVGTAPYFPIELSRMLATSRLTEWTFRVLLFTILYQQWAVITWLRLITWWCVFAVGLFDDVRFYKTHMAAVWSMALCIGVQCVLADNWAVRLAVYGVAMCLFVLRTLIKWLAVELLEPCDYVPISHAHLYVQATSRFVHQHRVSQHIMFTGKPSHPLTLRVFQVAGVMQWIALYLFVLCI
jgi:hypothetical protein